MQHILSLSYGKDSIACIGAIKALGLPLDRIVHVDVWATDTIPADLPLMVEFKKKADRIIKQMTGIDVEHIRSEYTFESYFYKRRGGRAKYANRINGFPMLRRNWCVGRLKTEIIDKQYKNAIAYIGIAADEPKRIARHSVPGKVLPLVQIGWDEAYCRKWCEEHDLLSPIYTTAARGGAGSAITKV